MHPLQRLDRRRRPPRAVRLDVLPAAQLIVDVCAELGEPVIRDALELVEKAGGGRHGGGRGVGGEVGAEAGVLGDGGGIEGRVRAGRAFGGCRNGLCAWLHRGEGMVLY